MRPAIQLLSLLTAMAMAAAASAQDRDKFAVVASAQEPVGIVWHVTDKIAVRPAIDFAHSSTETEGDLFALSSGILPRTGTSVTSFGLHVSALLYLARWDNLRAYVAPGYGHVWASQDDYSSVDVSNHQVEGLFGLQYGLGSRFAVFGEFGVAYSRFSAETSIEYPYIDLTGYLTEAQFVDRSSVPVYTTTSSLIGTRSRFGVTFYLK